MVDYKATVIHKEKCTDNVWVIYVAYLNNEDIVGSIWDMAAAYKLLSHHFRKFSKKIIGSVCY